MHTSAGVRSSVFGCRQKTCGWALWVAHDTATSAYFWKQVRVGVSVLGAHGSGCIKSVKTVAALGFE